LIIVDPERADLIEPIAANLPAEAGTTGILVLENHEGKGKWKGMRNWNHILNNFSESPQKKGWQDVPILPEDNATIIFTSGTCVLSESLNWTTDIVSVIHPIGQDCQKACSAPSVCF
jgi:long-subunit acyl-CoA synthetase (AMP-forming)